MLFQNVVLDGWPVDLRIEAGKVTQVVGRGAAAWDSGRPAPAPLGPALIPGANEVVERGGMLTPPLAEPHVHLDAALLGARKPNVTGTLREGIRNWAELRGGLSAEDVTERARTVLGWYAAHGTLRVRTHVDTEHMPSVEALVALRAALQGDPELGTVELSVVAFPQEGILRAPGRQQRWEAAVAAGCDAVGAIPHFERTREEGVHSVRMAFGLAERLGLRVDLHCDETDDPESRFLETVCAETTDRGFGGRVVAGHCTAMHSYPNPYADKIIELVAASGVQVVVNPLDNSVLQGRYDNYPKRRGLARVEALWEKKATVGIGHDSVLDPWYRLGTANLLDAAWMLVHIGHLTGEVELRRVFRTLHDENHGPWGGAPEIAVGASGPMLWWPESDPIEVLRLRPRPRVIHTGTLL